MERGGRRLIYIYRRSSSQSARALAQAVNGRRLRRLPTIPRYQDGDAIVCWGENLASPIPGGRPDVLNGAPIRSKYTDAVTLRAAGVPTIEVSETLPPAPPVPIDVLAELRRLGLELASCPNRAAAEANVATAQEYLSRPVVVPVASEWLPRLNSHQGGNDLLHPPAEPDYWVKRVNIRREFRVHSFLGQSIRAGVKQPREVDFQVHEWVRSWAAGWRISYDGSTTKQRHRDLAASAVRALGLQFGAVDIGERADGSALVLEVNRAPGLEGGTIAAYAQAILQWTNQD